MDLIVIVDVFRAFTTSCSILSQSPSVYYLTDQCAVVQQLLARISHTHGKEGRSPFDQIFGIAKSQYPQGIGDERGRKDDRTDADDLSRECEKCGLDREVDPILIGKPEIGSSLCYTIPNSPTRVQELSLCGRPVIHRTAAGGLGARLFEADSILAASFANAEATARVIMRVQPQNLQIVPMGHEGKTPTLEDDLCASYLMALIEGRSFALSPFIEALKAGSGACFFGADQRQYPEEDFYRCTTCNAFASPIFVENRGDFAILRTSGPFSSKASISSAITERTPLP